MRRLLLLALVGCGTEAPSLGASIVLDIPNAALDPVGFSLVEITMHTPDGDVVRSSAIAAGIFDLGDLDPLRATSIEAVLRDDSGAAVGYGRTAGITALESGAVIRIPVRRPIVYVAGLSYEFVGAQEAWFGVPATYSDLAAGTVLDGSTIVGEAPVLMVSAGPSLFSVEQAVLAPTGTLTGPATIREISTGDHTLAAPLPGTLTGAVQDGAGSDDGRTLVIGTAEKLFAVDTRAETAAQVRELAAGNFSRVALVTGEDGGVGAIALRNRVDTINACTPTAELWWIANVGDEVIDAKMIAMGGFADVASDNGRAWYVDACSGELGEATPTGIRSIRTGFTKPTAIAVANGQAWIGLERSSPARMELVAVAVNSADAIPRTLWTEAQEQILAATLLPGVERRLMARSATFQALELGAGGVYVAATISSTFFGARVNSANFPEMEIETEELRVFDAASGGTVQRYLSWCDGEYRPFVPSNDIDDWRCATTTGQTAARLGLDHRLGSMTFQFGKK